MKKNPWRGIAGLLSIGALAGTLATTKIERYVPRGNVLTDESVDDDEWNKFYNENGRIWTSYANEYIPQATSNWELYQRKVKEKNDGELEGDILLPDLDKNGLVGK